MMHKWWKEGVVYQIYPRSFYDSNGDGIGDLPGIIEKLDYLKDLGIDIIWISPVYKSPHDDNGYDISDYQDIAREFGTLEDMERLIEEAHQRGLKIIMDLVVNHTSDEHPWFRNSRSSKDNTYRDFYIWRKGKDGGPPNNWGSWFGGPAWEYDQLTDEYYLHIFSRKQPDLNWSNPELRESIYNMMQWWLNKGIDGFRMDVINLISKVDSLPDGKEIPGSQYGDGSPFFVNGPRVHEYLQEMHKRVTGKYDIMTVGETPGVTPEDARDYVNNDRNELNMLFHFELMDLDRKENKWTYREWTLTELKEIITKWYQALKDKGWNSLYLNNHDQPRLVSRFGNDKKYWKESAKMLATMLHTLPGTPYIYQGEEIGMTNVTFEDINDYRDIETLNWYQEKRDEGLDRNQIMKAIYRASRDNARTPVQWDNSFQAGFTSGTPWIKVNPNYRKINVQEQINDPDSILNYYKKLLRLRKRKENKALIYGDYQLILPEDEQLFAYFREYQGNRFLVILNYSEAKAFFSYDINYRGRELVLANYHTEDQQEFSEMELRPYEARVYRLR